MAPYRHCVVSTAGGAEEMGSHSIVLGRRGCASIAELHERAAPVGDAATAATAAQDNTPPPLANFFSYCSISYLYFLLYL